MTNNVDWDNYIICENGIDRKATPEEIKERKAFLKNHFTSIPSPDERLDAIEREWAEMKKSYEEGVNNA